MKIMASINDSVIIFVILYKVDVLNFESVDEIVKYVMH